MDPKETGLKGVDGLNESGSGQEQIQPGFRKCGNEHSGARNAENFLTR